ncbi:MAG: RNA methyltransferase [Pirellulaceae bacterium]|nr:RNA methyltransferase [Pirellulaceae bacterium]
MKEDSTSANEAYIQDLHHPLLAAYYDLRNRNWTWHSGIFIAEGPLVVQRLLNSHYQVQSVLLDQKYYAQYRPQVPDSIQLLVVPHELVERLVGFHFHRGVLACGVRPARKFITDYDLSQVDCAAQAECSDLQNRNEPSSTSATNQTWLGLIGVQDPENVGGMLRTAAGLGITGVLIGPSTADPLSRRALRVSMGNALSLQLIHCLDLKRDLQSFKKRGFSCVATTLSSNSLPLTSARRSGPVLLLMGNERYGLPNDVLTLADQCVRIEMHHCTDSLNVGVAAGIVMHHYCGHSGT